MGLGLDGDFFEYNDPPASKKEIIATSALLRLKTKIALDFEERARGRIRLVFGVRGSGKSTCLAYVLQVITTNYVGSRFVEFNAGRYTSKMSTMAAPDAVEYFLTSLAETISQGKEKDINKVIDALAKSGKKHFLLIDNLDRLYAQGADLELVQRLFQQADAVLKELAKHLVIVVTAAPEWAPVVKANDLSYLNYEGRVVLEGMSIDELRQAVDARLESRGLKRDAYFTNGFLNSMVVASVGNPRTIFQMLEAYNSPEAPQPPLKVEHLIPAHLEMVKKGAIAALQTVAASDGVLSGGVAKLVGYCDMVKVHRADLGPALRQIEACFKDPIKEDSIRFRNALGLIADLGQRHKWELREPVRNALLEWMRVTNLDLALLLRFVPDAAISFGTVGMEGFDNKYRRALLGPQLRRYEIAHDAYSQLSGGATESFTVAKSISLSWEGIEGLLLAVHSLSGLTPRIDDLARGLGNSSQFAGACADLIDGVNRAYVESGRGFNATSEDIRTLGNYKQSLFEDPTRVNLYRHEQMEDLRRAAIRVHETIVRQLTPAKLNEVRTRHLSKIQGLVAEGEGQLIEFKPAFRNDPKDQTKPNLEMEKRVMEGVCAFANADGGVVALGISNDHAILGMEPDIAQCKPANFDGFELMFRQRLDKRIPGLAPRIKLRELQGEGHSVVLVEVSEAAGQFVELVDIDEQSGKEIGKRFMVRTGNRNKELTGVDKALYQQSH